MRDLIVHPVRNERGVALPLALLGLVSVSLLVTTALVTSSTELAISGAHQDATAALYTAEGGLQAYVAQNGTTLQNVAGGGEFDFSPAGGGDEVRLSVVGLGAQRLANQSTLRLFTVVARPARGSGRTVAATVSQLVPSPVPLDLAITSAMTVGGDLSVNGNAFNVNGNSTACGSTGVEALRLAEDSQLTLGNAQQEETREARFVGTTDEGVVTSGQAVIQRTGTRSELAASILNGRTIDEVAADVPSSNWRYRATQPLYSNAWLEATLATPGGVAVVDAQGGTISLLPRTYTGILIVLNGSVELSGNVHFDGIIIAERNFTLSGGLTIDGALISLAMDGENVVENAIDDSALGNGGINVNYDRCNVQAALQAFGNVAPNTQTPIVRPTVAWLEVVR